MAHFTRLNVEGNSLGPSSYGILTNGTYTYVQNSANRATLTLTYDNNSSSTIKLSFTNSFQGTADNGFMYLDGFDIFTLTPTGGVSSARSLVNMSTLTSAKQGSSITFGFVIGGTQLREILVRAIGPSLAQFGISNFAVNPGYVMSGIPFTLPGETGRDTTSAWSATVASSTTLAAENTRAGAFPLAQGSNDKADVILLPPGSYTITVNPTDSSSEGTELVEVYDVQ